MPASSFLYQIIAAGELPIVRVHNRTLILDTDLRQFLERRRVPKSAVALPATSSDVVVASSDRLIETRRQGG